MSPKMREALTDITAAGAEGAYRKNWHGATVAALIRSGAVETVPGDDTMVRVPQAEAPVVVATPNLPTVVIPGHGWRWHEPQGGLPASTRCIQLMGPASDISPVALIMRNNDGTWYAEGRVNGMSGGIAGGYRGALTIEECAAAIATHVAQIRDAAQDALDAEQERTGVHAECGLKITDHCDRCDECPRTPGPCWCLATDDDESKITGACPHPLLNADGRCGSCGVYEPRAVTRADVLTWPAQEVIGEPVVIVEGSTAPGFTIPFGPKIIDTSGVDRITASDVANLPTPEEAVTVDLLRKRRWARRRKVTSGRRVSGRKVR